ncbi:MAG: carbohydrate-binding domain-containing protein [Ruminococcus sp.]|nr:carbohydrate-binding domain-containing protein [Ruminococcus sp.]
MKTKKLFSVILVLLMLLSVFPLTASAYSKEQATLTFTESGITETVSGSGYSIDGASLKITSDGTYRITGSCSEGTVEVAKSLTNVTLILDNLTLSSSNTAPIIVKKSSSVLMKLVGTSTITNNEDASKETTDPDNFEGAAIKVKSGSSLSIFGDGTLNAVGNAKNAIKGGAESSLTVDGGTIKATAVNNGIGFDGSIVINAGTFDVTSGNDGIKSEPDEGDTASAGTVTINGGSFTINAQGDGIVAAEKLTVNNGTFDIKTLDGYKSSGFNKDTMSCKGLKASGNNNNETAPTNELVINGGTFNLNTADDAIHSDGYCDITGGTFKIYTGDDGVHADATLTLGTENGYERDPEIYIYSSYEGLEGAVVNAYSGKYYVKASDDGINAAGGSSNGTQGQQGGDSFRPGGNRPGQGSFNPGGQSQSTGNYSLNIYGGSFYVDCEGDGLDSNGALNLLGGDITVLSMRSGGDNSPLDADGTVTINGATVFAAGSRGMGVNLSGSSQKAYTSSSSYNSGTVINVTSSGTTLRSEKLVRNINYLLYSAPSLGSCSVSTSASVDSCKSNAFAHNWDDGTTENGVIKYTCQDCGAVERKSIAKSATVTEYVEDDTVITPTENTTVYTATFNTDEHASIEVYYTQDYKTASETNAKTAVARNSDTGESDGTGEGQINFRVVTDDGYKVESVNVDGTYKNLKDLSLTELIDNLYRITKVASDLTITVTTTAETGEEEADKGYNISFVTDENSSINFYYTQDYKAASETGVTTAVSRNSTSGVPDSTGDGQVNFAVVAADGYEIDTVTVDGSYKNLKTPAELGTENIYRVTKVAGDLTITVKTKGKTSEETTEAQTIEPTTESSTQEPAETSLTNPVTEATATEAAEPTSTEATKSTEPATTEAAEPTSTEATKSTEPATTEAAEPTSTEATETAAASVTEVTEPSVQETTQAPATESTEQPTSSSTEATEAAEAQASKDDFKTVDSKIKTSKTEEIAGSTFGALKARATNIKKQALTLKWNKISGAVKYVIYANKCGTSNKYKMLATVSGSKSSVKVTNVAGKKLKKGTYYKFLIVAVDKNGKVISTSKTIHVATKGGKVGNYKSVTTAAKNNKVALKAGKTFKLKAKAVAQSKKLTVRKHRGIKYESSDKKIATVNSKGKITAKKKGTCYIYAYAQSGAYKRIKVTVK